MNRYVISLDMTGDQGEDGPVVTSPMGGAVIYTGPTAMEDAGEAARELVKNPQIHGAYVVLLKTVVLYTPLVRYRLEADESDPRSESN